MTYEPAIVRAGDEAVLTVDESVYSQPAVMRAAYWLTDRAYVLVTRPAAGSLRIHVRAKHTKPSLDAPRPDDPMELAGELANALLDHQLREEIAQRTQTIRETILERALGENGVFDEPVGDPRDPVAAAAGVDWPTR